MELRAIFLVYMVDYLLKFGIFCRYHDSGMSIEMVEMDENSKYKKLERKNNYMNYIISNDSVFIIDFPKSRLNKIQAFFYSLKNLMDTYNGDMFYISENSLKQYRLKLSIEKNSLFYKWCMQHYKEIFSIDIDNETIKVDPDIYLCLDITNIQYICSHCCKYLEPLQGYYLL